MCGNLCARAPTSAFAKGFRRPKKKKIGITLFLRLTREMAAVGNAPAPAPAAVTPAAKRRKAVGGSPMEQRALLADQLARQVDDQQRREMLAPPAAAVPRAPDASVAAKRYISVRPSCISSDFNGGKR
jgi:hypothetical protein